MVSRVKTKMPNAQPRYLRIPRANYTLYVMCSMKRDLKSANVNFRIVTCVIDDCLTNILRKNISKSAKIAELGYFEIGCKKLHFEKNNFEIYEPDFGDFWEKINFKTFHAQNYSQKMCSRSILNRPIPIWGLFYMKKAPSTFWHFFMGITPLGVFIF